MKTIKHFLLTLVALLCSISASAHDFEVGGIYYNITSSADMTVEVTFRGDSYSSYSREYTGSITIPESVSYEGMTYSVKGIGEMTFVGCPGLKEVTIGNSVTSIGGRAFYYCSGLTSVAIPNSVTSIGEYAFGSCETLASVKMSNSVTKIEGYAFSGCEALTSVVIPPSITSLGRRIFEGCKNLKTIINLSSLQFIISSNDNFSHMPSYSDIRKIDAPNGSIEEDFVFGIIENTNTLCGYLGDDSEIILPKNYKGEEYRIGANAISNNEFVIKVIIPNGVMDIGNYAFKGCCNLTDVNIPESVKSIGSNAFEGCLSLTSITIPQNVTKIGGWAFNRCSGLTDVYCLAPSVPEASEAFYSFTGLNIGNATLHVPVGSVEAYSATAPWSGFGKIVALAVEITIGSTEATTFCSEYALDFSEAEGVKAYAATGYNTRTGVVTLTRVKTAKAVTGLFVVGDEGTYSIPMIGSSDDNSLNMLVGVTEEVTIPTADDTYTNYIYGKSDDVAGFFKLTGDKVIPAGKAYLRIPTEWFPAVAESKIKIEFEDGTTTGIDDVEEQVRPNDGVIYDLHGRVVKNQGKGIYIVNGKKVLF